MNKRMTSSILAIVMLLCMLMPAMPASAAPSAATDSGLIISETALHPDDTFTVSLKIPEIPQKISDATLWVSFASDAFEVTDFTPPMLDNAQRIYSTVSEANAASRLSVVYGSLDYEQSIPFPAYTMTATMKVKTTATTGSYDFEVTSFVLGGLDSSGLPTDEAPALDVKKVTVTVGGAAATYTVKFDRNGGSGTMADVTGVSGAYSLPSCAFTAPTGKQFKGWATSASGAVIAGSTIDVTANRYPGSHLHRFFQRQWRLWHHG